MSSIKRLYDGYPVQDDSFISGRFPLALGDAPDPPGCVLGLNPFNPAVELYATYWDMLEIAMAAGYPPLEVVEQLQVDVDKLSARIVELERQLNEEINDLQIKAISKQISNATKDILRAHEDTLEAVRGRTRAPGAAAGPAKGRLARAVESAGQPEG